MSKIRDDIEKAYEQRFCQPDMIEIIQILEKSMISCAKHGLARVDFMTERGAEASAVACYLKDNGIPHGRDFHESVVTWNICVLDVYVGGVMA